MRHPFRHLLLSLACSAALAAQAQTPAGSFDLPAGDLASALNTLARQTDTQLVFRPDQLKGLNTQGVQGAASIEQALEQALRGSGFSASRDASGAFLIAPSAAAPATPSNNPQAAAAPAADEPIALDVVQVTGSRIPRSQVEGPAPITVISSLDIKASGFTSVPDVLRALTQNGGETQSQQSAGGADFSPGAQQVDLRGLGPNHTLVLVNGRRIADFPLPFGGRSNFTDVSSLPLGMIDRIEVLTGSASAIYGSDAISGVVNFILKKQADGLTVDVQYGQTERGDGESWRLNVSGGFTAGELTAVLGMEYRNQSPLWGFERSQQDSSLDGPTTNSRVPARNFLITDWWDDYIDPGEANCAGLYGLNDGSVRYVERRRYGMFCGSDRAVSYRTMISKRQGINTYASLNLPLANGSEWFADIQLGRHELSLFRAPRSWSLMMPDGNEEGYFYNAATDQIEYWQRQFTREEMGGLHTGMVNTVQNTFGVTTGLTGTFGTDWDYEAALSHSQYQARISWPQIVAAAANRLFLGEQLPGSYEWRGVDYPMFNAPHERMYRALTPAEYDSIFAYTTYRPKSESQTLAFTLTQASLFELSGGPAGFAATAEVGYQAYNLRPDPKATEYYYYSWKDSNGVGHRQRWALASELRMPILDSLNLSVAGRYDQYGFASRNVGKFTWSTGLEWRPVESLLVRGSYGTAFRAPDLHYVFAGDGNDETSVTDYYRCATEEPDEAIEDCSYESEGIIRSRAGNRELDPETSRSWTGGLVWSPTSFLDVSVDWFDIDMSNQVQDLRTNDVMLNERDCRLGALDINSPICVDALARITRLGDGQLYGVHVNPINIARERTNGLDATTNLRWDSNLGTFRVIGSYTWVNRHEIQQYPDEPVVDMFAINSGYDIPKTKASLRVSWSNDVWTTSIQGTRLGKLPNDDSYYEIWAESDGTNPWVKATYLYNANVQYRFNNHAELSLSVVNLLDEMPPYDETSTGYPYYDISWFDTEGRSFFLQYTHKFGGGKL
jgi:outer membrane receptor protein involved in Fe transport